MVTAMASGMDHVPFAKWLGLELIGCEGGRVAMRFAMRDELVGNSQKNILHGGIIAAALDTVGGLATLLGVLRRADEDAEVSPWLSTIDMRTDFLRPGTGTEFTVHAYPLRVGSRFAVTRMELHNENDDLIAVGTGTYAIP